jgi:phosphate transport system permease protein
MNIINRHYVNSISSIWMGICLGIVLLLPFVIGFGLVLKSYPILQKSSLFSLLIGSTWLPTEGKFGFLPFIISSLFVTVLSFIIAAPICFFSSIYLTQYSKKWMLSIMQPVIDILAGIPSVVYGVWGILVIVPFVRDIIAPIFNQPTSGFSLLAGGIVLAVMSIPFILNMLIEVFNSIPLELTESSLSIGATKWETVKFVIIRKGLSGIIASFGLGISKAFGETIAVLMVVGNIAKIPENMFSAGYPLPALIANNYGEMMSIPMYDSALMLAAFILFIIVLLFNFFSRLAISRGEVKN